MKIIPTKLSEVVILEPTVVKDERGYFIELFHQKEFSKHKIHTDFCQDNYSHSKANVLRGLHYQLQQPQGKLMSVIRGKIFDVAIDIRHGSPHFGEWISVILDDENHRQLYIPPGFAHGFCVLSDEADIHYKVTEFYNPNSEMGIIWNDDGLKIDWPKESFIISEKDQSLPKLGDIPVNKLPSYSTQ